MFERHTVGAQLQAAAHVSEGQKTIHGVGSDPCGGENTRSSEPDNLWPRGEHLRSFTGDLQGRCTRIGFLGQSVPSLSWTYACLRLGLVPIAYWPLHGEFALASSLPPAWLLIIGASGPVPPLEELLALRRHLEQATTFILDEKLSTSTIRTCAALNVRLMAPPEHPHEFLMHAYQYFKNHTLIEKEPAPVGTPAGPQDLHTAPSALVHRDLRYVDLASERIPLSPRELRLLELLGQQTSAWCSSEGLSQALLGGATPQKRRLLFQHMHQLRRKLGTAGDFLQSSKHLGYRCLLRVRFVDLQA